MAGGLTVLGRQLADLWGHFGVRQKASMILALVATVVAIGGLMAWSSRPSYRLLYSGMSMEDAAKAQEKLEEEKVLVQIRDSGHSLYVPSGDVYRCRLLLASAGLPKNTNVGFELFEKPSFGLTDFAQGVNYQRALQGELQNTITAMDGIESARVLLVLAKDKLFASEADRRATAAVMISAPSPLTAEQVRSVTHLVAAGVPGLNVRDITITDQNGQLLSRGGGEGNETVEAGGQMEIRAKIEDSLARKVQRMLDMALGPGRSTVQVSAEVDFSKTEKEQETYNSEGRVVRSETISTESTSTPGSPEGKAVGVTANIPVGNPTGGTLDQGTAKTKKEDIDTKYEVPRSMERIHEAGARIKGLSVSVCIAAEPTPRKEEDLARLKSMVGAAVGLVKSETRKDSIELVEMAFPVPAVAPKADWKQDLWAARSYARPVGLAALAIVVLLALRKKALSTLDIERRDVGMPLQTLSADNTVVVSGANRLPQIEEGSDLEMISGIAAQDPNTLASWIASVSEEEK